MHYAVAATTGVVSGAASAGVAVGLEGAGEDAIWLTAVLFAISTSGPLLLFWLSTWLLSLFSLLLSPDAEPSPDVPSAAIFGGAFHRGISQMTPVKLLTVKPPFCHLRHGLPLRSSARKPAFIAPWLALGPSLWAVPFAALGAVAE